MNDEQGHLHKSLERATAPGNELPADLDAESAGLRECWLALGKLLGDAEAVAGGAPPEAWKLSPPPQPRRWRIIAAVALAASLLIAVGATIGVRIFSQPGGQPADEQHLAHGKAGNEGVKPTVPQPNKPAATGNQIATGSDALDWSDSLDEQLTSVAQAAVSVRYDADLNLHGLSAVERGFDQLERTINSGTL